MQPWWTRSQDASRRSNHTKLCEDSYWRIAHCLAQFPTRACPGLCRWGTIIGNSHADPVPQNLLNFLLENPIGPQLDAAVKALPTITVRPATGFSHAPLCLRDRDAGDTKYERSVLCTKRLFAQ